MTNFGVLGRRLRTSSQTLASPVIGGRITLEFGSSWFITADRNIGRFGADDVDFTGSVLGMLGYKTRIFGQPMSLEAGYKALRLDVQKPNIETRATLNGAFVGFTG